MGQGTLPLAHLREDRLGSSLISAMSAFSPSMLPSQQIEFSAKLSHNRVGVLNVTNVFVPEPNVAQP